MDCDVYNIVFFITQIEWPCDFDIYVKIAFSDIVAARGDSNFHECILFFYDLSSLLSKMTYISESI